MAGEAYGARICGAGQLPSDGLWRVLGQGHFERNLCAASLAGAFGDVGGDVFGTAAQAK